MRQATAVLLVLAFGQAIGAEESKPDGEAADTIQDDNTMRLLTLGGLQFWADVHYFERWRIQRHALSEIFRLLDPNNRCRKIGSRDACVETLRQQTNNADLKPQQRSPTVLLLHGIIRTRHSMRGVAEVLEENGYRCYCVAYPSTRLSIEQHAENLQSIVDSLSEASELHFVCHSMGGLVVRAWMDEHGDDRVKRIVMMGTPNKGAEKADFFAKIGPYKWLFGPSGQQLVSTETGIACVLPPMVEKAEVGVIAGGKGNGRGYSLTLPGDDDGTVTVASTRLCGARDFLLVRAYHTFLMASSEVRQATVNFLKHGYFVSEEDRRPIPVDEAPKDESVEVGVKD